MRIAHDTRPCTPRGHSAFRGYDAFVGKMQSLYGQESAPSRGGACRCAKCGLWFGSPASLTDHTKARHGAAA